MLARSCEDWPWRDENLFSGSASRSQRRAERGVRDCPVGLPRNAVTPRRLAHSTRFTKHLPGMPGSMLPCSANTSGKGFRPTGQPQRTPASVILVFFNLNMTSHATKPTKLQRWNATLAKWAKHARCARSKTETTTAARSAMPFFLLFYFSFVLNLYFLEWHGLNRCRVLYMGPQRWRSGRASASHARGPWFESRCRTIPNRIKKKKSA